MKRPWLDSRCVLCLDSSKQLTNAHVIPTSVGGRLAIRFLCASCNSGLGHRVEGGLRSDPAVRHAVESVKATVPELARRLRDRQLFLAKTEHAVVRAIARGDQYRLLPSPQPDGSIVKDEQAARADIATRLRRAGAGETEVAAALAKHDAAPRDVVVELVPGLTVRKGSADRYELPYAEHLVADECLLGIAYLFLALGIGTAIYAPELGAVRAVLHGEAAHDVWKVEALRAERPCEPWHGLAVDDVEPHIVIQIRLFGRLAWRVHLSRISCRIGTFIRSYHLDLAEQRETIIPGPLWRPVAV